MHDPGRALKDRLARRCAFQASLRFEPFLALNTLLDPEARIHPLWRARAREALPPEFFERFEAIGSAWEVWPVLPSTLPDTLATPSFAQLLEGLRSRSLPDFQFRVLKGLLHSETEATALVRGALSLKDAIAKMPRAKREWLGYIGLYPFDECAPLVIALERMLAEPTAFRDSICRMLEIFWDREFQVLWSRMEPAYRSSSQSCQSSFESESLPGFARRMLLRVEIDQARGRIEAVRGGYSLAINEMRACHFMPSAFNDRRYWSALGQDDGSTIVYFPYFDPALALDQQGAAVDFSRPRLDPPLIFKALGDSTRFAIVSLLARKPVAAVELARILDVSKPTISHHVHMLDEAGLIQGVGERGAVLSLRRDVLERISELTVGQLFGDRRIKLTKTRSG